MGIKGKNIVGLHGGSAISKLAMLLALGVAAGDLCPLVGVPLMSATGALPSRCRPCEDREGGEPSWERTMHQRDLFRSSPRPWNTGRIIGPKPPFKPKHVWAIRQQLKASKRLRDLALFDCAIDAKLRGCDLVKLRVSDVAPGGSLRQRATVIQQKTGRPVPFEITADARSPCGLAGIAGSTA